MELWIISEFVEIFVELSTFLKSTVFYRSPKCHVAGCFCVEALNFFGRNFYTKGRSGAKTFCDECYHFICNFFRNTKIALGNFYDYFFIRKEVLKS